MSDPRVTVVVPTIGRPEDLEAGLARLAALEHDSFEVVVVDNSHGNAQVRAVAERAGARYVIEPDVGVSIARNTGAQEARGELVAFIDDNAFPEPGWLRAHDAALQDDPSLAATTGRILPWPADSAAARLYMRFGGEDLGGAGFRVDRSAPDWFERANFGGVGVGPNMVFRRRLFELGWGFRASLGPNRGIAGEEHYAFYTLLRDGHAIAYLPDAVVHHAAPESEAAVMARMRRIVDGGAAYALVLLLEARGDRRRLLRYVVRRGRGVDGDGLRPARYVSRRRLLGAAARAPVIYVAWVLRWRGRAFARPARVPATPRPW